MERVASKTSSKIKLKAIISGSTSLSRKTSYFDAAILTKIVKVHGKDGKTFSRLLVIQITHEIDIKKVLRHELSSVPLVLSNPDIASTCVRQQRMHCSSSCRFHLELYQ